MGFQRTSGPSRPERSALSSSNNNTETGSPPKISERGAEWLELPVEDQAYGG